MPQDEMSGDAGSTKDAIAQGLDAALDAVEPESQPAPAEEEVQEIVEPKEEEAEEREEEEEESQDEDIDPRVAPVIQRIKDGKVTENDMEMIARWRARADEAKEVKDRAQQNQMSAADKDLVLEMAKEHDGGEEYFAKHGAKATLEQIIKVRAKEEANGEVRDEPTKTSADDSRVRELEKRLDAREAAEEEARFNAEVKTAVKGVKELTPSQRDYVQRRVIAEAYTADPDQTVKDFVREVAQDFLSIVDTAKKDGKAEALEAGKKKAEKARPGQAPDKQPKRQKSQKKDSLNPSGELLSEALDDALDRIYAEESAT
jgi:hypothetical protein